MCVFNQPTNQPTTLPATANTRQHPAHTNKQVPHAATPQAHLMEPLPSVWVDGLPHTAQDTQAAAVMLRHIVVTVLHEAADEGGGCVQHTHLCVFGGVCGVCLLVVWRGRCVGQAQVDRKRGVNERHCSTR